MFHWPRVPGSVYVRWTWCRAVLHRGWWLVASVYLVVDAQLGASQLVLIGVAQAVVALVFEVPAGVVADTLSRKWALVVSHVLMGAAMLATALVDDQPGPDRRVRRDVPGQRRGRRLRAAVPVAAGRSRAGR